VSRRTGNNDRLLLALAEHLKLPLMQIARSAELARITNKPLLELESIELTADSALKLLDSYLFSTRLSNQRLTMVIEPVSVAGTLNNVAHELSKFARQYDCDLQIHMTGKYEPIMAHKIGLEAALSSIGRVLIEEAQTNRETIKPLVKLAAHRGKKGIVAGMFADNESLSTDMFHRAHRLYGRSGQPLTQLSSLDGTGVFVAESILSSMSAKLRVAHHQKLSGLAATFIPSSQLSLVE
jgi:hypothetical protein